MKIEYEQEKISALATAVNVLKGQGGGYTTEEKQKAADVLNREFSEELTWLQQQPESNANSQ